MIDKNIYCLLLKTWDMDVSGIDSPFQEARLTPWAQALPSTMGSASRVFFF